MGVGEDLREAIYWQLLPKEIVDFPVHVQFDDMEIAEDIQLSIFHYIKQRLIKKYMNEFSDVDIAKYRKRTLEDLIS